MNHLQFQVSIGTIALTWTSQGLLSRLDWYDNCRVGTPTDEESARSWFAIHRGNIPPVLSDLIIRMRGYFQLGEPIGEIPWDAIDQRGWTDFQRGVFRALTKVPHGETRPYSWIARRVGTASARAVGQALRKNPLPILIPCHRVVSTTTLGGFMGMSDPDQPELKLKSRLIELESSYINPVFSFLTPSWNLAAQPAARAHG